MSDSQPQQTAQVDVTAELLEPASGVVKLSINPVGSEVKLSFEQMDEYNFERLCARLASREAGVEKARRYGIRGQEQYGIDIYARLKQSNKYRVYQCKRFDRSQKDNKVADKELKEIVQKFLDGVEKAQAKGDTWLGEATSFVLCITVPLEKGRLTKLIENAYQDLLGKLEVIQWDSVQLTDLLREEPEIVEEFFGREAAERLCGYSSLLELPVSRFDPSSGASDNQLLIPRFRAIGFEGRDAKMTELQEWCKSGKRVRSWLITGEGGAGKTRLALELALLLRGQGWVAGFIRSDAAGVNDSSEWARLLKRNVPTLLIADYADALNLAPPGEKLAPLEAIYKSLEESQAPVRVLMLSREAGQWFTDLADNCSYVFHNHKEQIHSPQTILRVHNNPEQTQHLRQKEFERARDKFASDLGITPPDASTPNLLHSDFGRVLFIHMLALLACREQPLPSPNGEQVLRKLLGRERKSFWKKLVGQSNSRLDGLQRVMTLVTLGYSIESINELATIIKEERMLSDLSDSDILDIARGLQSIYPGQKSPQPLAPDLLAEHLIASTFFDLSEQPNPYADWVFERAFGTPENSPSLKTDLFKALPHLSRLTQRKEKLGLQLLERVLKVNPKVYAWFLFDLLPQQTVSMRELKAKCGQIVEQVARAIAKDNPEKIPYLARVLNNLGAMLNDLGYRQDTQKASREASEIYQKLAQADNTFLPDLAKSLTNFSLRQSEVGDHKEALITIHKAVKINYELIESNRNTFLPNLALSLNNLSTIQRIAGDSKGALITICEAVDLYRELADYNGDVFLPDLAMSLNNLSNCQSDIGDRKEALITIQEVVRIYHELTELNRDALLPDLALSLNNLSIRQSALGNREGALKTIQEALDLYRELAERNPNAFLPELATSLNNLSNRQSETGNHEGALKTIQEAVSIRRELVARNHDTFLPVLAGSLNNLSLRQSEAGNHEGALTAIQEAVKHYHKLAEHHRDAFLPVLAGSLNNLSTSQSAVGDHEGALKTIREAVNIRRELVAHNRDTFLPALASSLNNLSNRQSAVGDREGALKTIQEAVAYYRELDARLAGAFSVDYATSVIVLSDRFVESGDAKAAAKAAEQAVLILEPVFQEIPAAVLSKMAIFAKEYLERCETAGLEPDVELISRIDTKLQSLQPQESESAGRAGQMAELLASLPTALMEALQSGDAERFRAALAQLPSEQQQAILEAIQAQYSGSEEGVDRTIQELLENFDPLLQAIAAVALGNTEVQAQVEELLPQYEEGGWQFPQAVRRIWAGERDLQALVEGMDAQDTALVGRILEVIQGQGS